MWRTLRGDLIRALRSTFRSLDLVLAVVCLGLAIGLTSAVYQTATWLLEGKQAAIRNPGSLVDVRQAPHTRPEVATGLSYEQFKALEEVQDAFTGIAAYGKMTVIAADQRRAETAVREWVSSNYFALLGVEALLGRTLTAEDGLPGAPAVTVLSHRYWRTRFGGDGDVLGRTLTLDGAAAEIVGVLPPTFEGFSLDWLGPTDLWVPVGAAEALDWGIILRKPNPFYLVVGRLKQGRTVTSAAAVADQWYTALPSMDLAAMKPDGLVLKPINQGRIARRHEANVFLGSLLAVCVLVLLAAASNLGNLMMGRAHSRRRDVAIRAAVGASRAQVIGHVMVGVFVVALLSCATALVASIAFAKLLAPLPASYLHLPADMTFLTTDAVDAATLAPVVLLLTLASCGVLAVAASLSVFRHPLSALRGTRALWTWSRIRLTPRLLVLTLQIAFVVALSVQAAVLQRHFAARASLDVEMRGAEGLLFYQQTLVGIPTDQQATVHHDLFRAAEDIPGVRSVALGGHVPYTMGIGNVGTADGEPEEQVPWITVGPGYFSTAGIPLVKGREFSDLPTDSNTMVVNRTMAEHLWPGLDPIGRMARARGGLYRIIGVAAQERCTGPADEPDTCVWTRGSWVSRSKFIYARVGRDDAATRSAIRDLAGPTVAISEPTTVREVVDRLNSAERAAASLSGSLALFGILLLGLGAASLFRDLIRDSTPVLALRMALGADPVGLRIRVGTQAGLLLAIGTMVGLLIAGVTVPYLVSDVQPLPAVLRALWAPLSVIAITGAAVFRISVIATRVDPAERLREGV